MNKIRICSSRKAVCLGLLPFFLLLMTCFPAFADTATLYPTGNTPSGTVSGPTDAYSDNGTGALVSYSNSNLVLNGFNNTDLGTISDVTVWVKYQTTSAPGNDTYAFDAATDGSTFLFPVVGANITNQASYTTASLSLGALTWAQVGTLAVRCITAQTGGADNYDVDWDVAYIVVTYAPSTNTMLHNSTVLGSTRWAGSGGWGIAGGKYGEFTCGTCHDKLTGNIKRIRTTFAAPNGTDQFPIEADPTPPSVSFQDATDPTTDFGDDARVDKTESSHVCEACHTYDAAKIDGVEVHGYDMSGPGDSGHYNQQDCMICHPHNLGFQPQACDSCHGNPPTDTSSGGPNGLADSPNTTGSATAGAHTAHAITNSYACTNCHNGYVMPDESSINSGYGDISISFSNFGVTTGSYTGQSGVSYNNVFGTGTKTCSNVYCHSTGQSADGTSATPSAYSSPAWDGTAVCGSCHSSSDPGTGAHTVHINDGAGCDDCHVGNTHIDRQIDVTTGTYTAGGAPGNSYGTCSTASCHDDGRAPNITANWGSLISNCAECHETIPATGSHDQHVTSTLYAKAVCGDCHSGAVQATTAPAQHRDSNLDVTNYLTADKGLGGTFETCSNVYCHSPGQNSTGGALAGGDYATPTWGGGAACGTCHDVSDAALASGSHNAHLNSSIQAIGCDSCHTNAANDASTYDATTHVDGTIDVLAGVTYSGAGAPANGYGTCTTASCHGTATWGGASLSCDQCHTAASDTDDFTWGSTKAIIGTTEWTTSGHGGYGTANLACTDCHSSGVAHNSGTNYFRLSDNTNTLCMGCHNAIQGATPAVDGATHDGSGHSATDNGGYLCWDCHDPHGDAPIAMIQTRPWIRHDTNGKPTAIVDVDVTFSNNAAWGDFVVNASPWNGVCQACHESGTYAFTNGGFYRYSTYPTVSGGYDSTHQTGEGTGDACTSCHSHSAFQGSGDCVGCHGANYAPDTGAHLKHKVHILAIEPGMTETNQNDDLANWTAARHPICAVCHDMSTDTNHTDTTDYVVPDTNWQFDNSANPPAYDGAKTCSNINCHIKTTPAWQ